LRPYSVRKTLIINNLIRSDAKFPNFANGEQYVAVEGVWLGGTARCRNAKGEFSIRFDEFAPVNPNTQLVAESGTITGILGRDD